MRFSLFTFIAVATLTALAIGALFVPGAYSLYLPVLVILVLLLGSWRFSPFCYKSEGRGFAGHWKFVTLLCLLAVACVLYASVFDFAMNTFKHHQLVAQAKVRVKNAPDPEQLGLDTLMLLDRMLDDSRGNPCSIDPDSKAVPDSIAQLRPTQIVATKNYIVITLSPDGSAIIGYPGTEDYGVPAPTEHNTKLSDRVFYYDTH